MLHHGPGLGQTQIILLFIYSRYKQLHNKKVLVNFTIGKYSKRFQKCIEYWEGTPSTDEITPNSRAYILYANPLFIMLQSSSTHNGNYF